MSRAALLLLATLVLFAGCNSLATGPQTPIETPTPVETPPATDTATETVQEPRYDTVAPGSRLILEIETNTTVDATLYDYAGENPEPTSIENDSANWTSTASETFDQTPGRYSVTAFEPDGHVVVRRNATVVWEGWVGTYESIDLRIPETGNATVIDHVAI